MRNARNKMRVVGIILLGLFVLVIGVPLLLAAVGVTLGLITTLAVGLIKLAVVLAVAYLVLVGIRALLR
jgi:hypothetical protein